MPERAHAVLSLATRRPPPFVESPARLTVFARMTAAPPWPLAENAVKFLIQHRYADGTNITYIRVLRNLSRRDDVSGIELTVGCPGSWASGATNSDATPLNF